jgi:hypothetical protein
VKAVVAKPWNLAPVDLRLIEIGLDQLRDHRRGDRHGGQAVLDALGVAGGHAVQPEALEVGNQISQGAPHFSACSWS